MLRPWKQIYRLHFLCVIPILFQPCGVPGGGGGVAADVDHPAGGHAYHGRKGGLVAAFAGRVQHHDVRVQALGGQLCGCLPGISAEEAALGGNRCTHAGGIGLGAFDGFGYNLYAHQLTAVVCHGKADGAHAAVEIQQKVIRCQLGVFGSDAVELLSGKRVYLIKRKRAKLHRDAAEGVFNIPLSIQGVSLGTKDDIGVFCVDIQQDGDNVRKRLLQPGAQLVG